MDVLFKQLTILSKIDGLVNVLRQLTDAQMKSVQYMMIATGKSPPLPTDGFESMKYIAQDLLATIDEILQSDKML